jgi:hypothetical protein
MASAVNAALNSKQRSPGGLYFVAYRELCLDGPRPRSGIGGETSLARRGIGKERGRRGKGV